MAGSPEFWRSDQIRPGTASVPVKLLGIRSDNAAARSVSSDAYSTYSTGTAWL